jgi:hypothetical protein
LPENFFPTLDKLLQSLPVSRLRMRAMIWQQRYMEHATSRLDRDRNSYVEAELYVPCIALSQHTRSP